MHQDVIIALSAIGLISAVCQWFAWWVKLPAILFLLSAGIVLGPLTGWLQPDHLFGDLLFPMVSLAVAVILFEGSLTLKFHEIRGLQKVVRNLLTVGVSVILLITTLTTRYFLDFPWKLALLFGALMVVTGPTVIIPMLRTVRPNAVISNILRWEGIMIDPLGAILAVLVFEFIISGQLSSQDALSHTVMIFGKTLAIGLALGAAVGYGFGLVLRHHWLPEYLHNVTALTLVFAAFAVSNQVSDESGLLTVTVMGIWLANMKGVSVEDILDFKESLSVLLISGLFIILAARLDFVQFEPFGVNAIGVFLAIQFIGRPLKVWVSTLGTALTWQEKALLAWIGPRGIVAAAVSALFAIRLQEAGFEQASLLVPMTFTIIIGTVVLQSATARTIAKCLGVSEPDDKGILIVGANVVARAVARALNDQGYRTLLADSNWDNIIAARMEGLKTYYGKAASEHADRHLDLVGLGQIMALTPQQDFNELVCLRYRSEFGSNHCYLIATHPVKENGKIQSRTKTSTRNHVLFGDEVTYAKMASLIGQGAKIRQTKLTDNFNYQAYQAQYGRRSIPLFAITERQTLRCFVKGQAIEPDRGWMIVALVQESKETNANAG